MRFYHKPMKRFLRLFLSLALMALPVNSCYDDSDILNMLNDHELRIQALEKLCNEMNTNIASLQQIVAALQNNDFVTSVVPVFEGDKEVGYTITFSKSGPVTIYHGKDGKDGQDGKDGADGTDGVNGKEGSTPVIGVRQDEDDVWYWTLNGDWLLDEQGNKVKAVGVDGQDGKDGKDGQDGKDGKDGKDGTDGDDGQDGLDGQDGKDGKDGTDGQDGITPQLKIEDDYWYISYDNGQTWTQLGKAAGENGKDGTDGQDGTDGKDGTNGKDGTSFFESVTQDPDYVYLKLVDGTVFTLPKFLPLSFTFSNTADTLEVTKQQLLKINYRFQAATEKTHIEAISSSDISFILTIPVVTEDKGTYYGEGVLNIQVGDHVDAFSHVTVFLSDERTMLMRRYNFKKRKEDL